MNENRRPLPVTILSCAYILVGAVGIVFHFKELIPLNRDGLVVEFTDLLALLAGIFMLRRQNWARWLALAWMALHVIISAFHPVRELVVHALLLVVIAWILFLPSARRYFGAAGS